MSVISAMWDVRVRARREDGIDAIGMYTLPALDAEQATALGWMRAVGRGLRDVQVVRVEQATPAA